MSKTLRKHRRLNEERAVLPFVALRRGCDFGMVVTTWGHALLKEAVI
jgi:hypothetical protein